MKMFENVLLDYHESCLFGNSVSQYYKLANSEASLPHPLGRGINLDSVDNEELGE